MLVLTEADVRSLLSMPDLIEAMEEALGAFSDGQVTQPVRTVLEVGPDRGVRRVTIQDQARLERDPTFRAVAESAYRAVKRSSPLQLPPEKYSLWRDLVLNFSPQDLIDG